MMLSSHGFLHVNFSIANTSMEIRFNNETDTA
jgi:hypothetical protein